MDNVLYIFSGLPGSGKTTLAKNISKIIGAVYIRIDTIEQGIRDLCNPIKLTRNEYENLANENNCKYKNIEIICSDKNEHKKRVETRKNDIKNLKLPTWEEIQAREFDINNPCYYEPWENEHIIIDTANKNTEESINELINKIKME